jgi:hypothetical protein
MKPVEKMRGPVMIPASTISDCPNTSWFEADGSCVVVTPYARFAAYFHGFCGKMSSVE